MTRAELAECYRECSLPVFLMIAAFIVAAKINRKFK